MEGIYNGLFYGGLIAAVLFFILAIVLFFVFDIPKVFGDLTGRTAKKTIKMIQTKGYESKSKQSAILKQSDKIKVRDVDKKEEKKTTSSVKITSSKSDLTDETEMLFDGEGEVAQLLAANADSTEILIEGKDDATDVLMVEEDATDVLVAEEGATDVLMAEEDATDVLMAEEDATDILMAEDDATDVLKGPANERASNKLKTVVLNDVLGDAGETAVLISPMNQNNVDSNSLSKKKNSKPIIKEIKKATNKSKPSKVEIVYNAIVVNTNENL